MILTGPRCEELWEALRDAFNLNRLQQMLRFALDRRLDDITLAGDFKQVVFDLIQDAEMSGYTMQLVDAARRFQPNNGKLVAVAQQLRHSAVTTENERLVRERLKFLSVAQWRSQLGEAEVRVCKIDVPTESGRASGTGFLLGPDLVITNHHVVDYVISNRHLACDVIFRFDYKLLPDGRTLNPGTDFRLHKTDWYVDSSPSNSPTSGSDQNLDYALLRLADSPGQKPAVNAPGGQPRGWFQIPTHDVGLKAGDPIMILQHPQHRPLELAIDTDGVIAITHGGSRIQYRTNTESGSSGSPCCDFDWQLVALHRAGDLSYGEKSRRGDWNEGVLFKAIIKRLNETGCGSLINQPLPVA